MINSKGKEVCAIISLRSRRDAHKANISEDFQVMKGIVTDKKRSDLLHDWVVKKIKSTYVRMNDRYKNCDFQYQGWVK
jgi:peptidyl-prolyl cis-trans isomerase SurA